MNVWRARVWALLAAVTLLIAVSGPAAMADDDFFDDVFCVDEFGNVL